LTAQTQAVVPAATRGRGGIFLGFRTVFRKEIAEWVRGRRALIGGAVSVSLAVLSIIPFIVPKDSASAAVLSITYLGMVVHCSLNSLAVLLVASLVFQRL
jgi:hypothetical protein